MGTKRELIDEQGIMRAIKRISYEILERNKDLSKALIIGIERRGVYLGKRIQEQIEAIEGITLDMHHMNVSLYRDDIKGMLIEATTQKNNKRFDIDTTDRLVILVDDVLYTGRTIRSALNALMEAGRPSAIQLAVLIDRGHRELPIRADYVGKNIPTARAETVKVLVNEYDGEDSVIIY